MNNLFRNAVTTSILLMTVTVVTFSAPPPAMPSNPRLADELKLVIGSASNHRETDHFTIAYDTAPETLRGLTGRLEGTFNAVWTFCELYHIPITPPSERLPVIFLDKHADFVEYCRAAHVRVATAAGFYDSSTNRSTFLNTMNWPDVAQLDAVARRLKRQIAVSERSLADALQAQVSSMESQRDALVKRFNKLIIQHEAAHQVLFNIGVHVRGADNPVWLTEGLACQFEVPQSEIGRGKVQVNHMRLGDFREALGVAPHTNRLDPATLADALNSRRLVGFREFIRDGQVAEADNTLVTLRYSQCWAMVHYLLREHREAFGRYMIKLSRREPGRSIDASTRLAEFEEEFGAIPPDFDERWVEFMLRLRFDPREAN